MTSWKSSKWVEPKNWKSIRQKVFLRDDFTCTHVNDYGQRCVDRATDVDHIVQQGGEDLENLRSLCGPHHRLRSSSQGGTAAKKKLDKVKQSFRFDEYR